MADGSVPPAASRPLPGHATIAQRLKLYNLVEITAVVITDHAASVCEFASDPLKAATSSRRLPEPLHSSASLAIVGHAELRSAAPAEA
jgi:hypothetical protein